MQLVPPRLGARATRPETPPTRAGPRVSSPAVPEVDGVTQSQRHPGVGGGCPRPHEAGRWPGIDISVTGRTRGSNSLRVNRPIPPHMVTNHSGTPPAGLPGYHHCPVPTPTYSTAAPSIDIYTA